MFQLCDTPPTGVSNGKGNLAAVVLDDLRHRLCRSFGKQRVFGLDHHPNHRLGARGTDQ